MLCSQHAGKADIECSHCLAERLQQLRMLTSHLHEYREVLGETMKEAELLESLLTQTADLLDAVSSVSQAARSFIVSDPRYVDLAKWLKERTR
jgi:hypothetical protein